MRRKKEDAKQTKEDILNAAVEIFACKGVAAASLNEIAKAAHVTRGAVYWHFKNKMEIFDALHERLYQPLAEMILQDLEKDHPEPLIQMQELCIALLLDLKDNPQKRQALTLFMVKCDYSGDLAPYKNKHKTQKEQTLKLFARYVQKAQKQETVDPALDAMTFALALQCYMKGIVSEYLRAPEDFDITTLAPKLIELFFQNINGGR